MQPKVSVLLPVYNGSEKVADAVSSIQSQSWSDWELIILDDASQDDSLEVCHRLAESDKRIRVYRNPVNRGLAFSMNSLVGLSRGEYIAVQEQDDVSCPDRLTWEVTILNDQPEIGVVSGIASWLDDHDKEFALFPGILKRGDQYPQKNADMVRFLYVDQCKVVNAGCMFRRSVVAGNPAPFDEGAQMSIDWQFFIHAAHKWKIWGLHNVVVRMSRGEKHQHLTAKKALQFIEAQRCIRRIYNIYRFDEVSPINYLLFRRAMSAEMVLEGRYFGRIKGVHCLFVALMYDPFNRNAWKSLRETFMRGFEGLIGLGK